jgi:hypothetical protein
MTPEILSTAFIGTISAWAIWCVLSCKVRDGVFGKIIYAVIAIAGYAIVTRTENIFFSPSVAGITFHAGLAMAGIRHYFLVTHWVRVKAWICKYLHCEQCSNRGGKNQ